MNAGVLTDTIAVGVITGMRSMAGPALVARGRGRLLPGLVGLLAAGETVADKTSVIGDRTDALPLAGRAMLGALAGGCIAHEGGASVFAGAAVGAAAAVIAAHAACRARKRLALPNVIGGAIEDAIVLGIASVVAGRSSARRALRPI